MAEYPNWFNQIARQYFEDHLKEFKGKDNLMFLQIGVFTGDASVWLAENILTGKNCRLIDQDTWAGSEGESVHKEFDWTDVEATYDRKTAPYLVIDKVKADSRWFAASADMFDFIYIDADHTAKGVLGDAVRAFPALKKGGILAFDDYTWTHESGDPDLAPTKGINIFLDNYKDQIQLIELSSQAWIRKK